MGGSMNKAIESLKSLGIEAFELDGILVIPCSKPEDIYETANKARRVFKECGYEKSWRVDPYFYSRQDTLTHQMFGKETWTNDETN